MNNKALWTLAAAGWFLAFGLLGLGWYYLSGRGPITGAVSAATAVCPVTGKTVTAAPPTGYPDASGFWTSPGTVVLRFNALERAARGKDGYDFPPASAEGPPEAIVEAAIRRLFVGPISAETRSGAVDLVDRLTTRPERRAEQATAFLLSSPEFLTH